jgi:hypothetical protein
MSWEGYWALLRIRDRAILLPEAQGFTTRHCYPSVRFIRMENWRDNKLILFNTKHQRISSSEGELNEMLGNNAVLWFLSQEVNAR